MSRRREEAELLQALDLSTQQAAILAHLTPHTLSSATTADSRDLELRPAVAAYPTLLHCELSYLDTGRERLLHLCKPLR